jgi:glutathione S-transferase
MFLAEKSVAYDTIEVLIAEAAHQTDAFRRKNPLTLLPVLELPDGRVLRESMAICRFIEEEHPEPNLYGTDTWERAQIEMWNRHAELELLWPVSQVFRNTHQFWVGKIKQAPDFAEIMREHLDLRLSWLDGELANRHYIAGARFTVADITAVCALDFGKVSNIRINAETHPHLASWHKRVSERPSYKA